MIMLLEEWFQSVRDDTVVCDPNDLQHEANANLWCFSPSDDEASQLTAAEVEAFVRRVIDDRATHVTGMLFYCWHDAQVRQLRFSLVSESHGVLPFRCEHVRTDTLSRVIDPIVNGDWREGWTEQPPEDGLPLQVFVTRLAHD